MSGTKADVAVPRIINGKNLIKVFIFVSKDKPAAKETTSIHINKSLIKKHFKKNSLNPFLHYIKLVTNIIKKYLIIRD